MKTTTTVAELALIASITILLAFIVLLVRAPQSTASERLPAVAAIPPPAALLDSNGVSPSELPMQAPSSAVLKGQATWYASAGSGEAAAGPRLRKMLGAGWRGSSVDVCQSGKTWINCTRVRLTDWCACGGNRIIDLSDEDFSKFAPLSVGVIRVSIAIGAPPRERITNPPTDTE